MLPLGISALNPCDSFYIVPAVKDIKDSFLDTDDSIAAIGLRIPLIIAFLEGGKMGLEDALNEVVPPWDISCSLMLHILLKRSGGHSYA